VTIVGLLEPQSAPLTSSWSVNMSSIKLYILYWMAKS
jgi:hypothetical protein